MICEICGCKEGARVHIDFMGGRVAYCNTNKNCFKRAAVMLERLRTNGKKD